MILLWRYHREVSSLCYAEIILDNYNSYFIIYTQFIISPRSKISLYLFRINMLKYIHRWYKAIGPLRRSWKQCSPGENNWVYQSFQVASTFKGKKKKGRMGTEFPSGTKFASTISWTSQPQNLYQKINKTSIIFSICYFTIFVNILPFLLNPPA